MTAALFAFVVGAVLQLQQTTLWQAPVYMLMLPVALILWAQAAIKIVAKEGALFSLILGALTLGFALVGLRAHGVAATALDAGLEGKDIQLVGVVAAMPQRSEAGLRFRLDVESASISGHSVQVPPQIYLSWYSGLQRYEDPALAAFAELQRSSGDVAAGERWALTARLKAPHGNANPHGFDYELWLWEQGLQATGYVRATPADAARGEAPRKIGSTWLHPVERARQSVRDAIFSRVPDVRWAGVIAALVVGDQAAIERADWDIYRATGVAHLMSISGLHITMFAWCAAACVLWLWRRSQRACLWQPAPHAALVGGVLLAALYALFSGWGVPSQRTVWMLATVTLLRLSGKVWPWPLVWLTAMAVVVAVDPWALLQAGFWLSFVAVGVLFATDSGRDGGHLHASDAVLGADNPSAALGKTVAALPKAVLATGRAVWRMAREQWVITLALTPLSLLLFQQVSVVGLLANALAIPWVTLVVTPLAMLGTLVNPLWDVAAWCVQGMGGVLAWLAALPFATISIAAPALWMALAGIFGGLLLAMPLPWPLRVMGLPLLLPVLLFAPLRPAGGEFEIMAADIGQGNAVLVRTAQHSLLYDAGPRFSRESDAGQRTVVPLLRALGEKLDMLMLSHRDTDHIGGAAAVLAMQPRAVLVSSLEDGHEFLAQRSTMQSAQAVPASLTQRCVAGQQWQWDGVQFDVLHPQAADYAATKKSNAMSCVLRIASATRTALLVADIEAAQEASLVAQFAVSSATMQPQQSLRADILLVPHHGSKTSSTQAFLDAVQPRIALVQAGYRNRFNHPAPEVAQRYVDRQIQLVDSAHCGAATWSSAQPLAVTCQRQMYQRYWHHVVP